MARIVKKVPLVDEPPAENPANTGQRDAFEFRLLEADAKSRENVIRADDQRYYLRWIAVIVVLAIIIGMGALLIHVAHWLPDDTKLVGAVIALHLAPIVSMTTLAVALLVAAFRAFKDGDEQVGVAAAGEAAKVVGLSPR